MILFFFPFSSQVEATDAAVMILVGVVELFAVLSLLGLGVSVVIELVVPLVVVDDAVATAAAAAAFELLLFINLSPLPSTLSVR